MLSSKALGVFHFSWCCDVWRTVNGFRERIERIQAQISGKNLLAKTLNPFETHPKAFSCVLCGE